MVTEEFQNSVVASAPCAPVPGWVLWDLNPIVLCTQCRRITNSMWCLIGSKILSLFAQRGSRVDMQNGTFYRNNEAEAGGCILNMEKYLRSDLESSDQSCKIQVLFVLGHSEFHRIRVYTSIILSEGSGSFPWEGCALWQKLFLDLCMCVYLYKHP